MLRALPFRPALAGAALALSALLAGCATRPPTSPAYEGQRLHGRLSVQAADGQGGSSAFELLGTALVGQLELSTPLGSLVARASWDAQGVRLETPQQGSRLFASLDALGQELLGEAIPVAALFDWLQGRPWPQAEASPLPSPARGFVQLGWRIELDRFDDGLLVAKRLGEPMVTLRARLDR